MNSVAGDYLATVGGRTRRPGGHARIRWVASREGFRCVATGWTARARGAAPGCSLKAEPLGEPGCQHRACATRSPAPPPSRSRE